MIARDSEHRPLLLFPLALKQAHGVRCAVFMGGKHATFNMALWDREFAADATPADLEALISAISARRRSRRAGASPTAFALARSAKPDGAVAAPGVGQRLPVADDGAGRRADGTDQQLVSSPPEGQGTQAAAPSRLSLSRRDDSDAEINRLLDWFFRVKPLRMAEQKLPNVFADSGVEDFIRTACMTPLPAGGRAIDIHAFECDEEVIAIFAGVADGNRFSMMFNTYTMSANSKYSPGLILMRNIIDHYAGQNYRAFDLGIGSDEYKRLFCKSDEPIFDSFIPLSLRGKMAASAMSAVNRAKRTVKHNSAMLEIAQNLRSMFR